MKRAPLLSRPLILFLAAMILANIASNMQQPLLPLYLQSLGANVGDVGLFFTVSMIIPLAFQILGGWLSDSIGRLRAVAIGSLAGLAGFILFPLAPSWPWVWLSMVGVSIAIAFVAPSFQAYIAEQSSEENRGRVYGLVDSLYGVVGILGPALGGILADGVGFRWMLAVAAVFYGAATLMRIRMSRSAGFGAGRSSTHPSFKGLKTSLGAMLALISAGGVVTWIFISDGVRDMGFNLSTQLYPLYMQNLAGLSNTQIGLLTSLFAVTSMLVTVPGGWLSDKKGERVGIVSGFGLIVFGIGVFLRSHAFTGFAAAWMIWGAGIALISPAYNSLISKAVPSHLRGTAFGLFSTSIGFISLPMPYLGSLLWQKVSPAAPFLVNAIVYLLLLPIIWIKFRLPKAGLPLQPDTAENSPLSNEAGG